MKIAVIAHDSKKKAITQFMYAYKSYLEKHDIYATGSTGELIKEKTGLEITCFQAGPLGGNQEIGAMVSKNEIDLVLFLRDPLTVQPHEPDHSELMKLCDVHNIPMATNIGAAEIFVRASEVGAFDWRENIHERQEDEQAKLDIILKGIQNFIKF